MRQGTAWDALKSDASDGVRFARNAARSNGRERETLTQIAKSAGAAVLAWAIADRLLHLPLPYVAPLAAMLMVSTTVYRSMVSGARRVVAVAIGVTLALLVAKWVPTTELAMAIVLPLTLLLGQWRRLGDQGLYSPFAALFMITFGQPDGGYVLFRLAETGLGVVIGTVVNLLVFPPVHIRSVRKAASRAVDEATTLIRDIAGGLREDWTERDARSWARRATSLDSRISELRETIRLGSESLRFNPRRALTGRTEPVVAFRRVTDGVGRVAESVQTITDTLADAAREDSAGEALTREFRRRYSAVLESAADVLEVRLSPPSTSGGPAEDGSAQRGGARREHSAARIGELVTEVERQLARQGGHLATPGQQVSGSLLLAARQLRQDLDG